MYYKHEFWILHVILHIRSKYEVITYTIDEIIQQI